MERGRALRKVLACLRLAKSSNPNEAAAALRQARALMEQYGLTEDDALAAEITQTEAPTRCRGAMLPVSQCVLANIVACGFRCSPIIDANAWRSVTVVRFYGVPSDATVAAYAFTVLRRQMEADKSRHVKRVRIRANRERRGELFAIGWVRAVSALFPAAEIEEDRSRAIAKAVELGGPTATAKGREVGKHGRGNCEDTFKGFLAGRQAQLHNGIEENVRRRLEVSR